MENIQTEQQVLRVWCVIASYDYEGSAFPDSVWSSLELAQARKAERESRKDGPDEWSVEEYVVDANPGP